MQKSLIVKLGSIGDVACVLPAAWRLHRSGSEIDWLCGKQVLPLLSCYSWVRPVVVEDRRLFGNSRIAAIFELLRAWRTLLGASYELCATLHYDRRYSLLTLPVHARRTVALDWKRRAFQLVSERHHSAEYVRILCNLQDEYREEEIAPLAPDTLPVNPLPRDERARVALVPGGARNLLRDDPQRRWPVESYVSLARLLLGKGYEVVLTGGPGDEWVATKFEGVEVDNRIAHWEIPQTLAFYDSCNCVVTHDTGPLHLAGLTRCALVALFGPTPPSKFLPRRDNVVALWGGERLACRPCHDGYRCADCRWNGCMAAITPERVTKEVIKVLANPGTKWHIDQL
jgi:heptosyltransferase-2